MTEYFAVLTELEQYSESWSADWMLTLRPEAEFESATFMPSFSRMLKDILAPFPATAVSFTVTLSSREVFGFSAGASSTSRTLGRLVRLESVLSFLPSLAAGGILLHVCPERKPLTRLSPLFAKVLRTTW